MNIIAYLAKVIKGETGNYAKPGTTAEEKLQEIRDYVDEQYGYYLPNEPDEVKTPTFERYQYEAPTDEQIEDSAKAELGEYANESENNIRSEYEAKAKELEANKISSKELYDQNSEQLKAAYEEAAEALSNDSLKRGLARSSIAINNQAAASRAYTESADNLMNNYSQKVAAIDEELNSLDTQLQSALNSFKISYAAKLTERINELKAEREKNVQKALEYNNSLTKTEFENEITKEKAQSDLYTAALKQKEIELKLSESMTTEERARMYEAIYNKIVSILDTLPPAEARMMILNEPIFRECLSDIHYYMLRYRYKNNE